MKKIVYLAILRPLILTNYWMRARHLLRDKWFWADTLAISWGFWTK